MSDPGHELGRMRDPRLSPHAADALPAWLWSVDAARVLWANPVAAAIFNASSPAAIAGSTIDPKSTAALQVARIAGSLPHGGAPRLERLRGFGGRLGEALLCACSRIVLSDGTPAVLVVATAPAGPKLALDEQARRLLDRVSSAAALFTPGGALLAATPAARAILGDARSLSTLASAPATETIGSGASALLLATFATSGPQAITAVEPAQAATEPVPAQPEPASEPEAIPAEPQAEVTKAPMTDVAEITDTRLPEAPVAEAPPATPPAAPAPAADKRGPFQPLRFVWQMDADTRFTLTADEFVEVVGPLTASALGQPWQEIAQALALDPDGQVARAVASHDTWSGITVSFPVDGSPERLDVELSGLPVFDRDRTFRGYRGFGICRDTGRLALLLRARRATPAEAAYPAPDAGASAPSESALQPPAQESAQEPPVFQERPALTVVPPSPNVVPFRSSNPAERAPTLTPVEHKAFGELASRLTARLRNTESGAGEPEDIAAPPLAEPTAPPTQPDAPPLPVFAEDEPERTPATENQREILDRLPVGVLVYRLDNLLYANKAFLEWTGYGRLDLLADAGGLDALFVEPGVDTLGQNGAKSLAITTQKGSEFPVEARLFSTPWDGETALVLMLANPSAGNAAEAARLRAEADAAELRTIVEVAAAGVVVMDRAGRMTSVNSRAEMLFGPADAELSGLPFAGLFASDSQRTALDLLSRAATADAPLEGREVLARGRDGDGLPLFMTVGQLSGDRLCAVFQDIAPWKKTEDDLLRAKQQAEQASSAKSDFLAKISHEIRTPLNAILGFSEVMIAERFGTIGNDRYKQYLQDIHTSGEHVLALLNDLLDLSKIEAGKLELDFAAVDLNELTQQCVALMQPQANRERIIIRTSLAPTLQAVTADARSVRQIVLNLLSNSIRFTSAGGQVIVSTAINDSGEAVLRVRDTGVGMSEKDIAVAMEPFRQLATSPRQGSGGTGLGLPLTKALAEANRATFRIKSAVNAGTLIEVSFPTTKLAAE